MIGAAEHLGAPVRVTPPERILRVSEAGSDTGAHDGAPQVQCANQLLGPDTCGHPNGGWWSRPPDGLRDGTPGTAYLSCPDCLRSRIAAVPLHRLPARHPLLAAVADDAELTRLYVSRERGLAAVTDDQRPIISLEGLRDRDGVADITPAAHASRDPDPTPDPRSLPLGLRAQLNNHG